MPRWRPHQAPARPAQQRRCGPPCAHSTLYQTCWACPDSRSAGGAHTMCQLTQCVNLCQSLERRSRLSPAGCRAWLTTRAGGAAPCARAETCRAARSVSVTQSRYINIYRRSYRYDASAAAARVRRHTRTQHAVGTRARIS